MIREIGREQRDNNMVLRSSPISLIFGQSTVPIFETCSIPFLTRILSMPDRFAGETRRYPHRRQEYAFVTFNISAGAFP